MTCEQWVMLPTVTCNGYTLCDVVQMYPCQRYICDVCFEQLYRTKGTTVTCDGTPLQSVWTEAHQVCAAGGIAYALMKSGLL